MHRLKLYVDWDPEARWCVRKLRRSADRSLAKLTVRAPDRRIVTMAKARTGFVRMSRNCRVYDQKGFSAVTVSFGNPW